MSYIGAQPTTGSFPFDQFSGNGSTTAFTLTYAPASTSSIIVAVSGVVQNPNAYSCIGTTLTFSGAPPSGTNNISVLYLGLPVIGVSSPGNTAYFSSTSFTATGGQTTFTPSGSYQVGFINVIRNGSQLAPADYTATNGTTVVLNNACTAGDIVVIEVYTLTSISNALPLTGGTVTGATTFNTDVTVNGALASGYTGFKNRIINGAMNIWQRGTSYAVSGVYSYGAADRWASTNSSASTNSRSTDAATGFQYSYSIAASSAAYPGIAQRIESANCVDLVGQSVTLSCWIKKSSGTTEVDAALYYANSSDNFSGITQIGSTAVLASSPTSTWTKYTTTFTNLPANAVNGLQISIFTLSGSTSDTLLITGVQLERGSNATSFEFRDYGRELAMCQRYTYRHSAEGDIDNFAPLGMGRYYGTNAAQLYVPFKVTMRTSPSSVTQVGNVYVNDVAFGGSAITLSLNETSSSGATLTGTATTGVTAGNATTFYANNTSSAALIFSAEL